MALMKCHECGKDVSTSANNCSHCGAKVKNPTSLGTKLVLIFSAIPFLIVVVSLAKRSPAGNENVKPPLTPEQIAAEKTRDIELKFALVGAKQLKKSMKDPQAFELTRLFVTKNGHACYQYRAKNSFNAYLEGGAVLTPKLKMLLEEQHGNQFVNAWNRECTKDGKGENDLTALANRFYLED